MLKTSDLMFLCLCADPLLERDYSEIWHLWKLAGGDVFAEVRKSKTIHSVAPVLSLPLYVFFILCISNIYLVFVNLCLYLSYLLHVI